MEAGPLVPVAQYLRVSTNNQKYSIVNQRAAVAIYCHEHGMVPVQSYCDPGRSGLEIRNRPGLQQLLQDVISKPIYKAVVVFDVSRWGRFQDPDEAAHYEFICKSAGVPVHYCSEVFSNEESMANSLLKHLKRTMAGEFSRELGVKVFAGQKRLIGLGHKMGGVAGFGLRRCVVSPNGARRVLQPGQYKTLSTDWVVLVPGPASEVRRVRQIYELAADRGMLPASIARYLNKRNVRRPNGKSWTHHAIVEVLTNPKYVGMNVWARMTSRLKSKPRPVQRNQWIINEHAFQPLIDKNLFERVQKRLARRTWCQSNEDLLDDLRRLWKSKGRLSQQLIELSNMTPSAAAYARRFGSLLKAYQLIGYELHRNCESMIIQRKVRKGLRDEFLGDLVRSAGGRLEIVRLYNRRRPMLLLDHRVPCSVVLCPALTTSDGKVRWLARIREAERHYPALVCMLDRGNVGIKKKYLCPPLGRVAWYTRREHDALFRRGIEIKSGQELCAALERIAKSYELPKTLLIPNNRSRQ